MTVRPSDFLLSCWIFFSLNSPVAGQAGGDCRCNTTNSRCDETGVCRCDPGWDGAQCDQCVPKPGCVNGFCLQPWQCVCEGGWGGRFCDKDLGVCERRPCRNGATCQLDESGDFGCLCSEGFYGPRCEQRAGPCSRSRSPCKNGGLCEDANGFSAELTCHCLAGFSGRSCETDLDDCHMSPCANGATCLDGVNRFSCVCPPGFSGRFCTVNLDDCASRPCQNGARCLDGSGGFRCVCQPGFTGATCEQVARALDPKGPLEWEGGGGGSQRSSVTASSRHGDQMLKVTVSERGNGASLSEWQMISVLVLSVLTLTAVALTAALVLQGHCGRHGGHAHFGSWGTERQTQSGAMKVSGAEKKKLVAV